MYALSIEIIRSFVYHHSSENRRCALRRPIAAKKGGKSRYMTLVSYCHTAAMPAANNAIKNEDALDERRKSNTKKSSTLTLDEEIRLQLSFSVYC